MIFPVRGTTVKRSRRHVERTRHWYLRVKLNFRYRQFIFSRAYVIY